MNSLEWFVVILFLCIGVFIVGIVVGKLHARYSIANDCDKIGGFYVGNRIYQCKQVYNIADLED